MTDDQPRRFAGNPIARVADYREPRFDAEADAGVTVLIDGQPFRATPGCTAAAAIAQAADGPGVTRLSVSGMLRAPLCGMGICQECRVVIDGRPHRLACQVVCVPGMQIDTAQAAA